MKRRGEDDDACSGKHMPGRAEATVVYDEDGVYGIIIRL